MEKKEKNEVEKVFTFCWQNMDCKETDIRHFCELNHAPKELLATKISNPYIKEQG